MPARTRAERAVVLFHLHHPRSAQQHTAMGQLVRSLAAGRKASVLFRTLKRVRVEYNPYDGSSTTARYVSTPRPALLSLTRAQGVPEPCAHGRSAQGQLRPQGGAGAHRVVRQRANLARLRYVTWESPPQTCAMLTTT